MNDRKNEAGNLLPITVAEGITVNVLPSAEYEFLLSAADVGMGYGVSPYSINMTKARHEGELKEGKHYVTAITIRYSAPNTPHNKIFWTKAGIVRLGFFIRSERAKLFRDWAEQLVLNAGRPAKALPAARNHNRLTPARVASLLALICEVEDAGLRNALKKEVLHGTV